MSKNGLQLCPKSCCKKQQFPNAALLLPDNTKANYRDFLMTIEDPECLRAIIDTVPKFDFAIINATIDSMPISDIRKEFYKTMLTQRYEKILLPSYNRAIIAIKEMEQNIDEIDTDDIDLGDE